MRTYKFTESTVEEAALEWFEELGYAVLYGPEIAPEEPAAERQDYGEVILPGRLEQALAKLNPNFSADVRGDALRKLLRSEHPGLTDNNRRFHRLLMDGVPVEIQVDGRISYDSLKLIDFDNPAANDFLVVNQFTVIEDRHNRRPDIVVFVNGLPIAVFELKNAANANATAKHGFKQFQTYKQEIPSLFIFNENLVTSDGIDARTGTLTSDWERFMPWRTIDGTALASEKLPQLEILIKGIFEKKRLLELIRWFIVFEEKDQTVIKKMAGYHQYHAVEKAVEATIKAVRGDHRVGIVWHTQGSGKSLTMVFYAGKIVQRPELENPTLVILTDRNDLDDQLFNQTFVPCKDLLRQTPIQAESRAQLRELLSRGSGGIIFTTIQKFFPEEKGDSFPRLSDRKNIIIIADEAHRTQYDFIDGFAKHMRDALPNASFIGFTATPIETADRNTTAVFGNTIDVYDIHQSIQDKATVPIYYEARLAKLDLKEEEKPRIDPQFEEVTEGEEEPAKVKLKKKWARLESLVGADKRVHQVAADIVDHFEKRLQVMDGKGMIVAMSRRICVELYDAIIRLRPQWHDPDDNKGFLKVIMTGSASDDVSWQQHVRDKKRRREIGNNFKEPQSPIKLVIVRDMWLTGFDVPCLHTLYVDKPMRGHGLMQAIARVNRVFKDKPGGLIVDYLGIAHELKAALADYSEKDRGSAGIDQELAVAKLLEKHEVIKGMFHGFDYAQSFKAGPADQLRFINEAMAHILNLKDGKIRFLQTVTELSQAFALSVPHEKALAIRDEVSLFQAIKASLIKSTGPGGSGKDQDDLDVAVRQIVSGAVYSGKVVDVFGGRDGEKIDISILSDEFLAEVRNMPHKNLAVEALRKLLDDEIRLRQKKFLVQSRSFSDMLEKAIQEYHNRALDAAQVIEELIRLAKDMREAHKRGEKIGLTEDELAFYDALEVNDSAVKVLGDDVLGAIARDLVKTIRENLNVDWSVKETVRARMRVAVKRLLKQHGYPPDKQEQATQTVIEQAELLCKNWPEEDLTSSDIPEGRVIKLDIVPIRQVNPFITHLPVYSLKAAAGKFSDSQEVEELGWVKVENHKLNHEMFVAQVCGRSMEPKIPDGSYCIFRAHPAGSRQGKIVLAQYRGPSDPETGGQFTVKRYASEKLENPDGTWEHEKIRLEPINPKFQPIEIHPRDSDDIRVLAELVDVI